MSGPRARGIRPERGLRLVRREDFVQFEGYVLSYPGEKNWRSLPLDGAELAELLVFGRPKDALLQARLADGRRIEVPVSGGRTEVIARGPVTVETFGYGDLDLLITYRPPAGHVLVLEEAALDYRSGDDKWTRDLPLYLAPKRGIYQPCAVYCARILLHTRASVAPLGP